MDKIEWEFSQQKLDCVFCNKEAEYWLETTKAGVKMRLPVCPECAENGQAGTLRQQ